MLSSVSLRAQVASIIDALSKAAVAQIAKVVEDDVVVLRLEMCQRESEIKKLKRNIEILQSELRAAQQPRTVTPSPADRQGRDDYPIDIDDERTLPEKTQADTDQSSLSVSEVKSEIQVKSEPEGEATIVKPDQPCSYERDKAAQWRPATQGRDDCPIDVDDERTFPDADADQSRLSVSSFQVKSAPEDAAILKPDQPCSYERDKAAQWTPTTIPYSVQNNNSDYSNLGQHSMLCPPEDRGLASSSRGGLQQGYGQYRSLYNVVRRRTGMKRLMFKKGFLCPYCGKYFERSGHLERHKRIHTGEKPYRCEVCGRRFNQKCSLKEHMKIHRRHMQPRPFEIPVCEQKQIPVVNPCTDTHRAEEESLIKAEDVLPKNQDLLPTAIHIKAEPTEENIAPPLCHKDENQQTMAVADNLSDDLTTFERDGNHWMSRLPGQNGQKISSSEYLGSNVQSSFQGIRQLLRSPNEASCSTFSSFQSKPYGEFKNDTISLTPYGGSSSDMIMIAGESASHHGPIGSMQSFQMMKPKKCFVCSYCGKVFERSGHLERHLRIHTGEKPYECDVCGRCFNQKSSLKGHMKTHRNGDSTDMLDAHHLMFTSDNQMLKNFAEHRNGPTALEEPLPGSMYAGEPTVMVKLEPNGEDLQSLGQPGTGAQDQSQLWTSAVEKNGEQNVSVLFNEQQRYTSQIKDLPFLQEKENEKIIHNEQYLMMAMQSRSSDMTMAPELQDQILTQEMAVNEYSSVSDRTHNDGGAFDFNMATTGDNDNDTDATQQNCYICSACGQSFDNFGLFHRHQCQGATEQSFSCEICGKVFKQMSILKLHLKLHVESNHL